MNTYLDCYKDGVLMRRVSVTLANDQGKQRIQKELETMGYQVHVNKTEDELETGYL